MYKSFKIITTLMLAYIVMPLFAAAQYYGVQDTRALDWEFNLRKIGIDYTVDEEKRVSSSDNQYYSRYLESISPMVGVDMTGSIYHPNLMTFIISGAGGITEQTSKSVSSGIRNSSTETSSAIESGSLSAYISLLSQKPYGVRYRYSNLTVLRDYDFFSRVKVDVSTHDVHWGMHISDFSINMHYQNWKERVEDLLNPRLRTEGTFEIKAQHRPSPFFQTKLRSTFEDYTSERDGIEETDGGRQMFSLINDYKPLKNESLHLLSLWDVYLLESNGTERDRYHFYEKLNMKHSKSLTSFYSARYNKNDTKEYSSDGADLSADLRHRLYASLVSSASLTYSTSGISDASDGWDSQSFGRGISESYTKKLSGWGQLALDASLNQTTLERKTQSSQLRVLDERHTLTDGIKTFLRFTGADPQSVVVTDLAGTTTYIEGVDYRVFDLGQSVEIKRVIAGIIPDGAEILVDYTVTGLSTESYDSISRGHGASLSLLDGSLRLFANYYQSKNDGGGGLTFENRTSVVYGADISGDSYRFGMERRRNKSDYIPYKSLRFYQDYNIRYNKDSNILLSMSQLLADYPELNQSERVYSSVLTWSSRLTPIIHASLSAGIYDEKGRGIERDYEVYRGGLNWRLGLASLALSYDYSDERDGDSLTDRSSLNISFERSL